MYLYCKTMMDVNSVDSDESSREDGEIVDDIDLEDISDYSIPSVVGKCDSNDDDLFRAISLGSISDSECNNQQPTRSRQQQQLRILSSESYCKRKRRHRRRDRRKRSKISIVVDSPSPETITDCSNSDDSDHVDYETLHKLQKAVRINNSVNSGDCHHNSLRTRLKVMINNLTTESEDDIETLRALALISKGNKEQEEPVKDNNTEVVETILDDVNVETVLDDKELFELRSEALKSAILKKHQERKKRKENLNVNKENTVDKPPNNTLVDGETKIVETNSKKETSFEEDVDIMRAMLLASMSKKITSVTPIVTPSSSNLVIKPPLPLITQPKSVKTSSLSLNNKLSLPPVKPLIININNGESDSESDSKSPKKAAIFPNTQQTIKSTSADPSITKSVTEFLKLRRQQFEAKENNNNEELAVDKGKQLSKNGENCKDKSVVKLLPISQQREYQLLKRKLLIAKRKKLLMKMNVKVEADKKSEDNGEKKQRAPTSLKATLADLQVRQNGRLQMKGKYDDLASLLQLVNRASIERKKCENTMKKILEELSGAKMALSRSHRDFTVLVQKLVQEKRNIDRREGASLINSNTIRCTSTPLKSTCLKENNLEISKIISETSLLVAISAEKNCQSDELMMKEEETTTLRYVSPLDNRALYDRGGGGGGGGVIADPLGTICPFELFGDCKDSLCHFVHCGRRSSNINANTS